VQLMDGANPLAPLAAPGVLRCPGIAASETVVAVEVLVPHPSEQRPAARPKVGARTDSSPADLV